MTAARRISVPLMRSPKCSSVPTVGGPRLHKFMSCSYYTCSSVPLESRVTRVPAPQAFSPKYGHQLREHRSSNLYGTRMAHKIALSPGSDQKVLADAVERLVKPNGKWVLSENGQGLERSLKFKTFKAAWTFMDDVAVECRKQRHHPEWSNVYNQVFVRWTTHAARGLSEKDVQMADICDAFSSRDQSQLSTDPSPQESDALRRSVDRLATEGDCSCVEASAKANEKKKKIEEEESATGAQGALSGVGGQPS